jgi:phenylacetate-CoA ligase
MRRIERVTGRSDDMLIVRGVNLFPSQIEELVLAVPALAPQYLIEVFREGPMDRITIGVELRGTAGEQELIAVRKDLQYKIKTFCGLSAEIVINPPGAMERSHGKAVRAIDHRRPK